MSAGLLLSFLVSVAIGWFTVALFWSPDRHDPIAERLVRIFLAFGIGQGMTSCLAFLYLVVRGSASSSYFVVELPVLACVALVYLVANRRGAVREASSDSAPPRDDDAVRTPTVRLLAAAFYTSTAMALATVVLRSWQLPHGGYDAWAIWNARARAIFRAGDAWRDDIYRVVIGHAHLDYPLLLPGSVMRAWMYAGGETTLAPALIALLFTATTIGLLVATVAALCGRAHAYTAGLVLLGYTFFVLHANSQQAEAPIIYFYLATFVLLAFHNRGTAAKHRLLVLAGTAAGFAAWTKNEGLLFLLAVALGHFAGAMRARNRSAYVREMLAFAAGLLPIGAIILYFKIQLAPPNVWIADVTAPQLTAHVKDAGRYFAIAKEFAKRLILYDGPGVNLAYLLLLFAVCFGVTRRHIQTVAQTAITLVIMFCGFVAVYLATQSNIVSFMMGSIDRLLLQLWPGFVLAFFLLAAPAERDAVPSGARAAAAD